MPSFLILSINAGSSSLKTTLYLEEGDDGDKTLSKLASAQITEINSLPAHLKYVRGSYKSTTELQDVKDHRNAFENVLNAFLTDAEIPQAAHKEDIQYACHRVVHGGSFEEDQLITKETFDKIEKLSDLAPLYESVV
jgi:acetate kinase